MKNGVALSWITGVIERCVFLNDAPAVGIVSRDFAQLMRLKIEACSEFMRTGSFRDVVRYIAGK